MLKKNDNSIKEEFYKLNTREDVAYLLGIKDRSLRYFLYKIRPERMYHTFKVPKKYGEPRDISAPKKELKEIQKKLAIILNQIYEPKVCAFGFINEKSFLDNAKQHKKRNIILNIDLKDFFTQIHFGRIRGMLLKPPYSIGNEAATTIAQLVCFKKVLPQGAPTSPILTNMICAPLDNSLMRLAKKSGSTYTRYADDITFSTNRKMFDDSIVFTEKKQIVLGRSLLSTLDCHSFCVNPLKISLRSKNVRQEVTGLTVNEFPNLRRRYIKELRAILHHCELNGVYFTAKEFVAKGCCKNKHIIDIISDPKKEEEINNWFIKVLIGKINYIKQIKGKYDLTFIKYAKKLNIITNRCIFNIHDLDIFYELIKQNVYILKYENGDSYIQGSGFFIDGLGLVTSNHVTEGNEFFNVFSNIDYPDKFLGYIGKTINEIASDIDIDYALYKINLDPKPNFLFKLGDSSNLKIGDQVIIAGYPEHQKNTTAYIQTCTITRIKEFYLGSKFYTVSGRIGHGASGGVVLNKNLEIIGIIKGGIVSLDDEDEKNNINQGFVPIHLVMENLSEKGVLEN